jgi:hypothetical protein
LSWDSNFRLFFGSFLGYCWKSIINGSKCHCYRMNQEMKNLCNGFVRFDLIFEYKNCVKIWMRCYRKGKRR